MNKNQFILLLIILIIIIINYYNSYFYHYNYNISNNGIQKIIKESAKFAIKSTQDNDPFIKLLHSNYSIAYLKSLKELASDIDIIKATNIDIIKFTNHILYLHNIAIKNFIKFCPKYKYNNHQYLYNISNL